MCFVFIVDKFFQMLLLVNPQFLNQQGGLQTFDIVVANPPYSIKDYEWEAFKNKFGRLDGYDAPPEKNADYAHVANVIGHVLFHL